MRMFVLAGALLLSGAASAETFTVGREGGMRCKDSKTLGDVLVSYLVSGKAGAEGCGTLAPGTVISVKYMDNNDGVLIGEGSAANVNNGDPFAFITLAAKDEGETYRPSQAKEPLEKRTFKSVSPADVRATPTKWKNRDIAFSTVRVYWVDDDDVRLLTSESLTVFAQKVKADPDDYNFFRTNCETVREAQSSKCRALVRFSYAEFGEDSPNGLTNRTTLLTRDAWLVRLRGR